LVLKFVSVFIILVPGLSFQKVDGRGDARDAVTTPEQEEQLLGPIRAPSTKRVLWNFDPCRESDDTTSFFKPDMLPADKIHLELEFGATSFYLYGTLFRLLWFFKVSHLSSQIRVCN
jgi:hypothetical protein